MNAHNAKDELLKSVDLTFQILDEIRARDGAGVTALSQKFGVSKSTIHRHLSTLRKHGYVVQEGQTYHVGLRFLDLSMYVCQRKQTYEFIKKKVGELTDITGERVQYIVEENGYGVYVFSEIGEDGIYAKARVGKRAPLHALSGGKAILSQLPKSRVKKIIDRRSLKRFTENTITDEDTLFAELEEVRERGFAVNKGEWTDDLYAVGVPICNSENKLFSGLSVSGPAYRMTDSRMEDEIANYLHGIAKETKTHIIYEETK
jgi:DNA-binding IclR family transcriptional regulator